MDLAIIRELSENYAGGLKKLAADVGMSETNLHRCMRTNRMQADDLAKIARALRVSVSTFFEDEEPKAAPAISAEPSPSAGGEEKTSLIPLIHIDSVGGVFSNNELMVSEQYVERMVPFPDVRQGDFAIHQTGDSMAPTIPSGAIIQLRIVQNWQEYFGYGEVFVLVLDDGRRITKQIVRCDADPRNYVTCRSFNPDRSDEDLPRNLIRAVFRVVNVLIPMAQ